MKRRYCMLLLLCGVVMVSACDKAKDGKVRPEGTEQAGGAGDRAEGDKSEPKRDEPPPKGKAGAEEPQPEPQKPSEPSEPSTPEESEKQKAITAAQAELDKARKALKEVEGSLTEEERKFPTEEEIVGEMNGELKEEAKSHMSGGVHDGLKHEIAGPSELVVDGSRLKPYMEEVNRIVIEMNTHRTFLRYQQMLELMPSLQEQIGHIKREAKSEAYRSTIVAFLEMVDTEGLTRDLEAAVRNPASGSKESKAVKELFEHNGYMHFEGGGIPQGPEGSGMPLGMKWSEHIALIGRYAARFEQLRLGEMESAMDVSKEFYDAGNYLKYVEGFGGLYDLADKLDKNLENTAAYVFSNEAMLKTNVYNYVYTVGEDLGAKALVAKYNEVRASGKPRLKKARAIDAKKRKIEEAQKALEKAEQELAKLQKGS
ncbi:MAG: hypothetical protein CSA07_01260 [Bacteroidia bacterium]|nr:MAG: hypothetical protein CSA07_01260 [Bacteroidia bacterium]